MLIYNKKFLIKLKPLRMVIPITLLLSIFSLPIVAIQAVSISEEHLITIDNSKQPNDFSNWADIAISWSEYRLGSMEWYEMCASFVANAFMNTEATSWNGANAKLVEVNAIDLPDKFNLTLHDTEPEGWTYAPRGALIFFDKATNNPYGHVAIYLGNNQIIHSYGIVTISNLNELNFGNNNLIIGKYIGWTYPPDPEWRPENPIPQILTTFSRALDDSPISFRVYDSAGRVTGIVNSKIQAEIPGSFYYSHSKEVTIAPAYDNYRIEILSDKETAYSLTVLSSDIFGLFTLNLKKVQTDSGIIHQYEIDWDKFTVGENGITLTINGETTTYSTPGITFEPYIISSTGPYSFEGTLNYWKITVIDEEIPLPETSITPQKELTISSEKGGVVTSPGEGTFIYDENAVVILEAQADDGFKFKGWSSNNEIIDNSVNKSVIITMNGSYSVTANFEKSSNATLLIIAGSIILLAFVIAFYFLRSKLICR